jgi:hypothetical protein
MRDYFPKCAYNALKFVSYDVIISVKYMSLYGQHSLDWQLSAISYLFNELTYSSDQKVSIRRPMTHCIKFIKSLNIACRFPNRSCDSLHQVYTIIVWLIASSLHKHNSVHQACIMSHLFLPQYNLIWHNIFLFQGTYKANNQLKHNLHNN